MGCSLVFAVWASRQRWGITLEKYQYFVGVFFVFFFFSGAVTATSILLWVL